VISAVDDGEVVEVLDGAMVGRIVFLVRVRTEGDKCFDATGSGWFLLNLKKREKKERRRKRMKR
jgi:hypothetical protein